MKIDFTNLSWFLIIKCLFITTAVNNRISPIETKNSEVDAFPSRQTPEGEVNPSIPPNNHSADRSETKDECETSKVEERERWEVCQLCRPCTMHIKHSSQTFFTKVERISHVTEILGIDDESDSTFLGDFPC